MWADPVVSHLRLLLFSLLWIVAETKSSHKHVIASLHAKWTQTSLLAETSEFMAKESNKIFWDFVDQVAQTEKAEEWNSYSDSKQHQYAIKLASTFLSPGRIQLLRFALALRVHSPAVQLFQQIGSQKSKVSCDAYADIHGYIACSEFEVTDIVQKDYDDREVPPVVYSVDHVYPEGKHSEITVIVYGELGTSSWVSLHNAAKRLAKSGQIRYVLRHWRKDTSDEKVLMSGYGVELAIKNTEYKAMDDSNVPGRPDEGNTSEEDSAADEDISGFNFNVLRKLHPESKEHLHEFRLHLLEKDELTPLRRWEVQDLSYQASLRIIEAGPEKAIETLANISQNFPVFAHSLTRQSVPSSFRLEVADNQNGKLDDLGIPEGESALFVNGIFLDIDSLDVFSLIDILKEEQNLAEGFHRMGMSEYYRSVLVNVDISNDQTSYALDFREANPEYLNNLDTDYRYRQWSNVVERLLQPYFMGMIRPIARNFFTLIFIVDPSVRESRSLLKYAYTFFAHEIPIRLGVVFVVNENKAVSGLQDASVAMLNLYNYVKTDEGVANAILALTKVYDAAEGRDFLTAKDVVRHFSKVYSDQDVNDVFGPESDYDHGRTTGQEFLRKSGLGSTPKVLLNGIVLDDAGITPERFEETVITEIMKVTPKLQQAIRKGKLKNRDNVMNWILSQPEVMPRLNKRILDAVGSPKTLRLDFTHIERCPANNVAQFILLSPSMQTQCIFRRMRYLARSDDNIIRSSTLWIVTDLETQEGRLLYYNAIRHLKKSHTMRIGLINNPKQPSEASKHTSISMLVNGALRLLPHTQSKQFITKLVKEEIVSQLLEKKKTIDDFAVHEMNMESYRKGLKQLNSDEIIMDSKFAQKVLGLVAGERGVIANGMLIGPLDGDENFVEDDIMLLEKLMQSSGAQAVTDHLKKVFILDEISFLTDRIVRSVALINSTPLKRKRLLANFDELEESIVKIPGNNEDAVIDLVAVVDPLTKTAQHLSALVAVIRQIVNCDITIVMNPKAKLSELPLKRFYRMVLTPSMRFSESGQISVDQYEAKFSSLPEKQLFTLNLIPADSWMVQASYAVYDLDNIKMELATGNVKGEFELENILLEGHCFDEQSGNPPRGLQFTLGTPTDPVMYDTIVMANLGYFQLKANPGAWILQLREGKSSKIYTISSHYNTEMEENGEIYVLIDSFAGRTVRVRVSKKEGMQDQNLLDEPKQDEDEESNSIWKSISSSLTGGEKYDVINIFSLASGHLYERLMRIMFVSVMRHTKHPVKFWLLKNYLSPQFKETLPVMADHYKFDYELVEYKWPRWLHQQTEKQRVMWGHKILFLDVLFPLDLKKIIFVDADQIVRADLMELMELDLGGAPYGFTPFCDSRKEMDGFRFWKKGYWASHLGGRKYHISALYVVDLVKFRQIAAGDRLRGQYQGLSSDPNSLANLDQDLPNNMIHQVRIKSLPQEWLWCETWCDDASKEKAKTIDMCNNPLTKEPKLKLAARICPEWSVYDNEIKKLLAGELTRENGDEKLNKVTDDHSEL
ncbi:hypothetical protein AB6A40_000375 [Gnathostoma spinigerum]|uniref:UDP-glucose:glycoprotein glucosyltransferase 1 n=1 Tax=Gnathostoma spinigerum TaxID=75299 RepID=A0ABD6E401_9BILA